jgi:O-antigen ligase
MTGAIILTRSRAGWLATAAALSMMSVAALIGRRAHPGLVRLRRALPVAGVLGVAVALVVIVPNRLTWRSDAPYTETLSRLTEYASGSGRGRLIQWRNSARLAVESPLVGVGPGNWFVHYPRVTSTGDPSFARGQPIPTNPWPSSDWFATVSERGVPGVLLLLAAGVAAAAVALRRVVVDDEVRSAHGGAAGTDGKAARALAALGILAAAFVAGLFDAVLLLAAPAFFVATSLGALLPRTTPVLQRVPAPRARMALTTAMLVFSSLLTVLTCGRLGALLTAQDRQSREQLERAAKLDPGGHRVHLLLATRGPCAERIPHGRAARALMPFHDAPERALRACGIRE